MAEIRVFPSRQVLVPAIAPELAGETIALRDVISARKRHVGRFGRRSLSATGLPQQGVSRLYSSLEPKALETSALVALGTGLTMEPRPDLHENDRTGLGFVGQDELQRRFRVFFDQSARVTIGKRPRMGPLSDSLPRSTTSWLQPEVKMQLS